MTYAIVYSSPTGNTEVLAKEIRKNLGTSECIYYGETSSQALKAETIFVGFWTDKGSCDEKAEEFLKGLSEKRIILFGTAGFGGSQQYFEGVLEQVKKCVPKENTVLGAFMCQGKMPITVRQRYEKMLEANPQDPKASALIENFDQAASHPSQEDLGHLGVWLRTLL